MVAHAQQTETLDAAIQRHQYDLKADGKTFLLKEAERASFFLLGELHGDNEMPALIYALWPSLWRAGYRHMAAEVSPWAAHHLEFKSSAFGASGHGLWRKTEAELVTALKSDSKAVLWGCDIEEVSPDKLIRELADRSPANAPLQRMLEQTRGGYNRSSAVELLVTARRAAQARVPRESAKLLQELTQTLEVESLRATSGRRMDASIRRELVMKQMFLESYRKASGRPKVVARFGRNHLHRGYDKRGVSTLGNFIAEFAIAQGQSSFHVAAFGAGGSVRLGGRTIDGDETSDDPGFALLAAKARHAETVFDLRPIRSLLHGLPEAKRSPAEASLLYWADSYDAMICYRQVTPLPE